MRKKVVIILLLSLVLAIASPVFASSNIRVYINNSLLHLEDSPFIQDGRTLFIMRTFFQALGAAVDWEEETRSIKISWADVNNRKELPEPEQPEKITVLNPRGQPPPIRGYAMAPRLETLAGKTLYMVDIGYPGTEILFDALENWFGENMPQVEIVIRSKYGDYFTDDPELWEEIKEKGDAVIMGVGH